LTAPARSIFVADGDVLVPTELARGPWDEQAMHGGPPSSVLTRAIEAAEPPAGVRMEIARVTVELLRPIPIEPVRVDAQVVRPGRRVQLVDATMTLAATGIEVARARALRIRVAPVRLPHEDPVRGPLLVPDPPPGTPESGVAREPNDDEYAAFHRDAIELRYVKGSFDDPGPVVTWGRLAVPVVGGERPSPLQRTLALSDMGNGVSSIVDFDTHLFINPELSVHLWRPPTGEWIALRSRTYLDDHGIGLAETALYDGVGRFGRAEQSLLVDAR
jgi:hypothetical protein